MEVDLGETFTAAAPSLVTFLEAILSRSSGDGSFDFTLGLSADVLSEDLWKTA